MLIVFANNYTDQDEIMHCEAMLYTPRDSSLLSAFNSVIFQFKLCRSVWCYFSSAIMTRVVQIYIWCKLNQIINYIQTRDNPKRKRYKIILQGIMYLKGEVHLTTTSTNKSLL